MLSNLYLFQREWLPNICILSCLKYTILSLSNTNLCLLPFWKTHSVYAVTRLAASEKDLSKSIFALRSSECQNGFLFAYVFIFADGKTRPAIST